MKKGLKYRTMRKLVIVLFVLSAFFLSSCAEGVLIGAGIVAGGAAGYYAGKEGYKVKIEKEE